MYVGEHVGRGHVAVHEREGRRVQGPERFEQVVGEAERRGHVEGALQGAQEGEGVGAVDPVEGEPGALGVGAIVQVLDDPWVVHPAGHPHLVGKHRQRLVGVARALADALDRHGATAFEVGRHPHRGHAPFARHSVEAVPTGNAASVVHRSPGPYPLGPEASKFLTAISPGSPVAGQGRPHNGLEIRAILPRAGGAWRSAAARPRGCARAG